MVEKKEKEEKQCVSLSFNYYVICRWHTTQIGAKIEAA